MCAGKENINFSNLFIQNMEHTCMFRAIAVYSLIFSLIQIEMMTMRCRVSDESWREVWCLVSLEW